MENEPETLENPPQRYQNYPAQNVVIYDDTVLSKRIELIESGHRRIERSQEDMRDRFKKMENNIDSIEKLTKEGLKVHIETKRKDEAYWEKLTNIKDDVSKKAINLGMGVMLAVAVGLLIPYFKSEKLALVDDPDFVKILTNWEKGHLQNQAPQPPVVTTDYLVSLKFVNLRTEPKISSKSLTTLPPNKRVKILKKYGGWNLISYFDHVKNREVKGWAYHEYFTPEKRSS
ncbi:SH3 domain-containing protein [Bacteriovoracales bacterium]|nr:SH3 domain-containing protein [Bacteriovoracales bacterium]